jgi:hypothetical protein
MLELSIVFLLIIIAALIFETIDSGLGMFYGTILTPVLIIAGYDPKVVVPAVLLSQAIGGFAATYHHNKYKNAEFSWKSEDLRIAAFIFGVGIISVIVGAYIGLKLPKEYLKWYIGILCVVMGSIVLARKKFNFSWKKIGFIGALSAFNKSISGGGYGPIVATGNVASGLKARAAIGITDFAEAPICLSAFATWVILNHWKIPSYDLLISLSIGAFAGGLIGPILISRSKSHLLVARIVAVLAIISGVVLITLGL